MAITQAQWRVVGAASIVIAAGMAAHSMASGLLRDTVLRTTQRLVPESAEELTAEFPLWWILVYWGIFSGLILLSCYLALIDFRYIRLQYALERRQIFSRTVGDAKFRASLSKKEKDKKREGFEEQQGRDSP